MLCQLSMLPAMALPRRLTEQPDGVPHARLAAPAVSPVCTRRGRYPTLALRLNPHVRET
jgi:hypothetical protein